MTTKWKILLVAAVVILAAVGITWWNKMFREVPQPAWIHENQRDSFLYGSVGAEETAGIPYWIFLVLPRIFPEYMPEGGYAGLGFPWEETREVPAGFAKKTVGYVRVGANCALCHASSHPSDPDSTPSVYAAGPGQTMTLERLLLFYKQCAEDPRFTAGDILGEIESWTKLSLLDRLIYRFILIPRTRERFLRGDSVLVDAALLHHSQSPRAGDFRPRLQTLESSLTGPEKDALATYLKTLQ